MREVTVFRVANKDFPIAFCPIRLEVLWRELAGTQQEAVRLASAYVALGREVEQRKKTQEVAQADAAALAAKMTELGVDDLPRRLLDAVKLCLEANDLVYDRDWWETQVQTDEVIVFLAGVTSTDPERKRMLSQLLAMKPPAAAGEV